MSRVAASSRYVATQRGACEPGAHVVLADREARGFGRVCLAYRGWRAHGGSGDWRAHGGAARGALFFALCARQKEHITLTGRLMGQHAVAPPVAAWLSGRHSDSEGPRSSATRLEGDGSSWLGGTRTRSFDFAPDDTLSGLPPRTSALGKRGPGLRPRRNAESYHWPGMAPQIRRYEFPVCFAWTAISGVGWTASGTGSRARAAQR